VLEGRDDVRVRDEGCMPGGLVGGNYVRVMDEGWDVGRVMRRSVLWMKDGMSGGL